MEAFWSIYKYEEKLYRLRQFVQLEVLMEIDKERIKNIECPDLSRFLPSEIIEVPIVILCKLKN